MKFQLILVRIIHVKILEHVYEHRIIVIFVVFVQLIIPVEHVKFISKMIVHHHPVLLMQHVRIYRMDIDVFVHRMIYVIKTKFSIRPVRYRITGLTNVSMVHVMKANALVFLVGQELSVRKILMNAKVIHVPIKELVT